jgi:hypothetical protein
VRAVPRWRAFVVLAALAAIGATPGGTALAGGSRDLADTWLVGPEDLVPAGAAGWHVGIGAGRVFGLAELPQWRCEGQVSRRSWRAGLAWERLGAGLYCEDGVRLHGCLGRRWTVGLEVGADRLALATAEPSLWPALAVRVGGSPARGLRLEIWCHLREAPPWYGTSGLRRLALLTGGGQEWAWGVAVDRAVDGRPTLQGEVLARVAPVACLGLRIDPWSGALGLSTAWRVRVGWLRTSHLVHPELGTTHRWALVLGAGTRSAP